jgi:hypothetical protein
MFSIFNKKNKNTQLLLELDEKGDITIDLAIGDKSTEHAVNVAKMLYGFSHGYFTENILKTLVQLSEQDKSYEDSIKTIVNTWYGYTSQYTINMNKPLVSPSAFNPK